jgi:hypothetical protein
MDEKRIYPRVSLHTEIWLGQDGIFRKRTGCSETSVREAPILKRPSSFPWGAC